MAENAGLDNHRIKSFKNKGRDVEVSCCINAPIKTRIVLDSFRNTTVFGPRWGSLAAATAACYLAKLA